MISATEFATKHNSFWHQNFSALEHYVRVINSGAYDRILPTIKWDVEPKRSYLVSEIGFCLIKHAADKTYSIDNAVTDAVNRLSRLPGVPEETEPPSEDEIRSAHELASRIGRMLRTLEPEDAAVIYDPQFLGCGALMKSYGDALKGGTLIEIKSVDRGFRSSDFRQLLTYVFQGTFSGHYTIDKIAILNARRGILHCAKLPQLMFDISGLNINEAQLRFLAAVGMGSISR